MICYYYLHSDDCLCCCLLGVLFLLILFTFNVWVYWLMFDVLDNRGYA